MADKKLKGKTFGEIFDNKPGRGWGVNILSGEYVPPKGGTPKGRQESGVWVQLDGKYIISAFGRGDDVEKYVVRDDSGKTHGKLKDYLSEFGYEMGKENVKIFHDPEEAKKSIEKPKKTSGTLLTREEIITKEFKNILGAWR